MPQPKQLSLNFDSQDKRNSEASQPPTVPPARQGSEPIHRVSAFIRKTRATTYRTCDDDELPLFRSPSRATGSTIEGDDRVISVPPPPVARSEKAKAHDILGALRVVKQLDDEQRLPTSDERRALVRFSGFGAVALRIFPDPTTGSYRDQGWQELGEELQVLLSPAGYDSAKRSTFNAFYTSPTVMLAMHRALDQLGIPEDALILEPGCGIGNFMGLAPAGQRFVGVELDRTSGRIAKALYPQHDIRIEDFRDTRLPEGQIDAVIGNVPFANIKLDYRGARFSLHDYFLTKSTDALKPGGVLSLVTSHFTLDKQNAAVREYLGERADFLGAIRLPSDAFKDEGTAVVTDILFLRRRAPDTPAQHVDATWMETAPFAIEGSDVSINRYFLGRPEMVLGHWSRDHQLYGGDGYSVRSNGNLAEQLEAAIGRLPGVNPARRPPAQEERITARLARPPPLAHVTEGSFFVREDRTICQVIDGIATPVAHGRTLLRSDGSKTGKRLAALIALRDEARRVLASQNEGRPESEREAARRSLNWIYDRFVRTYGPINHTTLGRTRDGSSIEWHVVLSQVVGPK